MDFDEKGKVKKGLMIKTWERCQSFRRKNIRKPRPPRVAPEGCFSIYVGPQKQRFVIKIEYVNHPLFKTLLEEAESEYGYSTQGPLLLPCDVHIFLKLLVQMEYSDEVEYSDEINALHQRSCGFVRSHSSYSLLIG